MTSAAKPWPHTVIYDTEAVVELLAMKSKEEGPRRAIRRTIEIR